MLETAHRTLSDGSVYLSFNPEIMKYLIDWLNDEEIPTFSENEVGMKEEVVKLANKLGFCSLAQSLSVIPENKRKSEFVKISQEKLITTVNFQTGFHGGTVSYWFLFFSIFIFFKFFFCFKILIIIIILFSFSFLLR